MLTAAELEELTGRVLDEKLSLDERERALLAMQHVDADLMPAASDTIIKIAGDECADKRLRVAAGTTLARIRVPLGIVDNLILGLILDDAFWAYNDEVGQILGTRPGQDWARYQQRHLND
jgi:hypothetical protein